METYKINKKQDNVGVSPLFKDGKLESGSQDLDLDRDGYSAYVHMDKIAEVFLFISLCNPLRWHEGKKTVQFSTEAA